MSGHGSHGITLEVDIAGVDTAIGQVASMTPPKSTVGSEKMKGLTDKFGTPCATGSLDYDNSTFQLYFDPIDDSHEYLLVITHNPDHADFGKLLTWTLTFAQIAAIDPWIYLGLAKSFAILTEVDKLLRADCEVEVANSTQLPTETAV